MVGGGVLSRLWTDSCRVFVRMPVEDAAGVTQMQERLLHDCLACRLSYYQSVRDIAARTGETGAAKLRQLAKLILPLGIDVPAGSRIELSREGRLLQFCSSSLPMIYRNHQEILLENFDRWA